ncbi:MAG TPA: class I SAM-dependent methyltransferase [Terriglobia bacterium]|nr:class I SAM-dependent methyltransferase [Terriglobia bacterium]
MNNSDRIIASYSRNAVEYAGVNNTESCWGALSRDLWPNLRINLNHRLVVDVGCGPGTTLLYLAELFKSTTRLIGIEPAENMRALCSKLTVHCPNIMVSGGRFESLPLEDSSVDYLYSILAFHWVTNAELAVREISRVLSADASGDIFFVGRWNGREFIHKTTPIFFKYMGAAQLFASARLRQQFTASAAMDLFKNALPGKTIHIQEIYRTYYDTLAGHWRWWVRIAGQLDCLSQAERSGCEKEIRDALQELEGPSGIPFTTHVLHAKITTQRPQGESVAM